MRHQVINSLIDPHAPDILHNWKNLHVDPSQNNVVVPLINDFHLTEEKMKHVDSLFDEKNRDDLRQDNND